MTTSDPKPVADPKKNPSYPQRVHLSEKPHWQGVLQSIEARLAAPRQKLSVLGNDPKRALFEKLYAQMLGARDQVADAVRRLPMETGGSTRRITTGSRRPSPPSSGPSRSGTPERARTPVGGTRCPSPKP